MAYLATERDYLAPLNEFPTGKGFADIVYLPMSANAKDKPALIIELKKDARSVQLKTIFKNNERIY